MTRNNHKYSKKNKIFLLKSGWCTRQSDETQGNSSTQALSTKMVFSGVGRETDNKRRRKQSQVKSKNLIIPHRASQLNVSVRLTFLHLSSSLSVLFFASFFFCCLSIFLHRRRQFLSRALVFDCFLVLRRIGEYISLHLFYFGNLSSSCSLIPKIWVIVPP